MAFNSSYLPTDIPAYIPTFSLNPLFVTLTNADTFSVAATGTALGDISLGTLSPANAGITLTTTASGVNVQKLISVSTPM